MGAKKRPMYRVVVADSRVQRDGRIIESLGTYNPGTDPGTVTIDQDRARYWLSCGAKPSETVRNLFKRSGVFQTEA